MAYVCAFLVSPASFTVPGATDLGINPNTLRDEIPVRICTHAQMSTHAIAIVHPRFAISSRHANSRQQQFNEPTAAPGSTALPFKLRAVREKSNESPFTGNRNPK